MRKFLRKPLVQFFFQTLSFCLLGAAFIDTILDRRHFVGDLATMRAVLYSATELVDAHNHTLDAG